jgi:hypothetical protein
VASATGNDTIRVSRHRAVWLESESVSSVLRMVATSPTQASVFGVVHNL